MESQSIAHIVKRYGLLTGAAMIILSLITILMMDPSSMSSLIIVGIIGIVGSILVYGLSSFLAIKAQRDDLQSGAISFAEGFKVALLVLLVGIVMSILFSWIYYNFIDSQYANTLADGMSAFLEKQGLPESQIEEQAEKLRNSGSVASLAKSGLIAAVIALVCSAIMASILKKETDSTLLDT